MYLTEKLIEQFHPVKNIGLSPFDDIVIKTRIWWKCPIADDHEWDTSLGSRYYSNSECPYCSNQKVCESNCLATVCPHLLDQWHPTLNGDLTPFDLIAGGHKKVWWKCSAADDHVWDATPYNRSRCPYCSNQKVCKSNCLAAVCPHLLVQWHPTLNNKLTPFDIIAGYRKKIWWKCPVADDHVWESTPSLRYHQNIGCPFCSNKKICKSNCLSTTHPEIAKEWHPILNGNLTPFEVVAGSAKKIWWKCSAADDHEWQAKPNCRIYSKQGCPYCSGNCVCKSNCLSTTHPEVAKEWHPTLNKDLTPYDVVCGFQKHNVWWKCSNDSLHEWQASVVNRTYHSSGCPYCKESRGEKSIAKYLNNNNIKYLREHRFDEIKNYRFDFWIQNSDFCGIIEYHGSQHYIPKSFGTDKSNTSCIDSLEGNIKRDCEKLKWCYNHSIPVFVIPYWDYQNIELILDCIFNKNEIIFSKIPNEVIKFNRLRSELRKKLGINSQEKLYGLVF